MDSKKSQQHRYSARSVGPPATAEYRVYIEQDGQVVSPWHDIPLFADDGKTVLHMVVEIPRWTNAKYEISRDEALNPIKQDLKDGKPRFVKNTFPYKGYIWNYGAVPQTWEDPGAIHPDTGHRGDKDPLDACEIGSRVALRGEVLQVKLLGVVCLIDGEDTDWKLIVIDVNDPLASKLNSIDDVNAHCPGLLDATRDWFRVYKVPDGKPPNGFALDGRFKDKAYAEDVLRECSDTWQRLIAGKHQAKDISTKNTCIVGSPERVHAGTMDLFKDGGVATEPTDFGDDGWYFVTRS